MKRQTLLLLAIILLGLNLRPVLAAVGPLLDRIQLDTHLGHVGASLLTSPEFTHLKRHCLALLRHEEGRELPRLTPLGLPDTDHPPLRIAL